VEPPGRYAGAYNKGILPVEGMLETIDELVSSSDIPFICEIGLNHEGSMEKARYLIDKICEAGGKYVKFQYRSKAGVEETLLAKEIGAEYIGEYIRRTYLNFEEYSRLDQYARRKGLTSLFSVWDCAAACEIKELGHKVVKIGSGDLSNIHLVKQCQELGLELIVSTGLHTGEETREILSTYKQWGVRFLAMHCQSTYPAPHHHLHLGFIKELEEITGLGVGYSCHSLDNYILPLALGLGARFFEKHVTFSRSGTGNDHKASILPSELEEVLGMLQRLSTTGYKNRDRPLSPGERLNQLALRKGARSKVDTGKDAIIQEEEIEPSYEAGGVSIYELVMKKLGPTRRAIKKGEIVRREHFQQEGRFMEYRLEAFGLPCRFHDAKEVIKRFRPTWVEYHLSLKDLDRIEDYRLPHAWTCFHAPDYFEGDFFLCTRDDEKTEQSFSHLRSLGKQVTELLQRSGYRQTVKPHVVVSIGNETEVSERLSKREVQECYENCGKMLNKLNKEFELEFIPQTLPERAWYLGGQRRINTFANPDEVLDFCSKYKINICYDTAHTILACNSLGKDWATYTESLYRIARSVHLADAEGVDNEGLQIGEGELTRDVIRSIGLGKKTWMPEIWQGHREDYKGFSDALDIIQGILDGKEQ
jgi:sialic acid synthase SpsE/sugar phosphate isomerase/epimerase